MQRRRHHAARQDRKTSARLEKIILAIKMDAIRYAQPRVEIEEVDATPEQYVLAVVDQLGIVVARRGRTGAAATAGWLQKPARTPVRASRAAPGRTFRWCCCARKRPPGGFRHRSARNTLWRRAPARLDPRHRTCNR